MLHAGVDLSRHRLDVHILAEDGSTLEVTTAPPDRDGLRSLVRQVARDCGQEEVLAVIESMNGARFVHDTLELAGWSVEIADPRKVKGLAPLACKTDRIDAWALAELSRRTSSRRSGCPTHRYAPSGNGRDFGFFWSNTAARSRTASTQA
jgi:transposase